MGGSLRQPGSVIGGTIGVIIGYTALVLATTGVLLCMDAMECFLHALRLHW
jgi:vacuolar-type H+-ATPase subunit I/STV1